MVKISPHRAHLRHARHYAQVSFQAELLYREGKQEEGLMLFDRERGQIDTGRNWTLQQTSSPETDDLILDYADAAASIGEIRYRIREERIPQLEIQIAAAQRRGQQRAEGQALGNLALAFAYVGDYDRAITSYSQRILLARTIGDRRGECVALSNLGNAYKDQGNYRQALECHQHSLDLCRALGDQRGEGAQLGNIGNIYYSLGDYEQAIAHLEQHLTLARAVGDQRGEGGALGNLALAYGGCRQYERAVAYALQALEVLRSPIGGCS